MSEPVRLFHVDGQVLDCAAPSEVVRLQAAGWMTEAERNARAFEYVKGASVEQLQGDISAAIDKAQKSDADEIPFATPLPKRRMKMDRKPSKGDGVL